MPIISSRLVVNQAALKLKREPIRRLDRRLRARAVAAAAHDADARPAAPRRRSRRRLRRRASQRAAALVGRRPTRRSSRRVAAILADVRARGDAAVLEYTRPLRRLEAATVAALELDAGRAAGRASTSLPADAARRARGRGARACAATTSASSEACGESWSYRDADGTLLGQKVTPLDRVGIYVPGGKAAYPSSVLMNAIPAQVAGVGEIVMVVPTPRRRDATRWCWRPRTSPASTACSRSAARRRSARWPTARATMPRGRQDHRPRQRLRRERQAARVRHGRHRHDRRARARSWCWPTARTPPDWVAMDLFSQAEHDELAQSILLCPDAGYIERGAARRSTGCCRRCRARRIIAASLERPRRADPHARAWKRPARSPTASRPSTSRSPARDPHRWEPLLRHAGAIFLGALHERERWATTAPGPNHVLPTSRTARFSSPLGVYDFQKRTQPDRGQRGRRADARPDRRRAGARRRPAGARARRRDCGSKRATDERPLDDDRARRRIARRIRQDVQVDARLCDPADAPGWSSSTRWRTRTACPRRCRRELGERLGAVAINRYPGDRVDDADARRWRAHVELPAGCDADARQRLGRADLAARAGLRRARRDDPRAAARLRDVRA